LEKAEVKTRIGTKSTLLVTKTGRKTIKRVSLAEK